MIGQVNQIGRLDVTGRVITGRVIAGRVIAGRVIAGLVIAGLVVSGRVVAKLGKILHVGDVSPDE